MSFQRSYWSTGWWTSMNSPPGRRTMRPDSKPCSTISRSFFLQRDADALGDEVSEDRAQEQQRLQRVDDAFHREHEVRRDEVGRCCSPEDGVEDDAGDADRGARRRVAGTLCDVVLALVAGDPRLDERVVSRRPTMNRPSTSTGAMIPKDHVRVEEHDVPVRRRQTQSAVGEADVPVRAACRPRQGTGRTGRSSRSG